MTMADSMLCSDAPGGKGTGGVAHLLVLLDLDVGLARDEVRDHHVGGRRRNVAAVRGDPVVLRPAPQGDGATPVGLRGGGQRTVPRTFTVTLPLARP